VEAQDAVSLAGGVDPDVPAAQDLQASASDGVPRLEGPITVNICGYLRDASQADGSDPAAYFVGTTIASSSFPDRQDIFIVNDSCPPRAPGVPSSSYKITMQGPLLYSAGDSYSASYGPWIIIPNPQLVGRTVAVPPGGAIMGMMARIDATVGVFRAPAGVIAGLNNAVGVQAKFTDTELGDLNAQNVNVIRSVVGAGICVMGGRTRKSYGTDRYISARRTLIFIKEIMRRSTQFAVFENNDQRLWSALRMSGERVLRPLWEAGGLRGSSASEAYFVRCDSTINTDAVISSGEVRMELGVALEYPAEFVIIRVTQFDQGTFTAEIQPAA
jgi:phage tail sheath protein FI